MDSGRQLGTALASSVAEGWCGTVGTSCGIER